MLSPFAFRSHRLLGFSVFFFVCLKGVEDEGDGGRRGEAEGEEKRRGRGRVVGKLI